jgi:hypothetical protein
LMLSSMHAPITFAIGWVRLKQGWAVCRSDFQPV